MLSSPHILDICLICGVMVRCSGCGMNCCSGGENCGQCASAYEAQTRIANGEPVEFAKITVTFQKIQERLRGDLEHLPDSRSVEDQEWLEAKKQRVLAEAVWDWNLLRTALAFQQL
jgi:hypothetical protein